MWNTIFKDFLPHTQYTILYASDCELYKENEEEGGFCEIWIPVADTQATQ